MGKAIVIPDCDFSVNKIGIVHFIDGVPCTGLSVTPTAVEMTRLGSTAELSVMKTPANTTDSVIWSSSDPDIVDVASGTLVQTGVGIATITAICGEYSATCVVTCTTVYNGNTDLLRIATGAGYKPSNVDYVRYLDANGYLFYANLGGYGDYPIFSDQNNIPQAYKGKGAIPIPHGASKIAVTNPDPAVFDWLYLYFVDSKTAATLGSTHDSAKLILVPTRISIASVARKEINLEDYVLGESDSFVLSFYDKEQAVVSDTSLNSIITIS